MRAHWTFHRLLLLVFAGAVLMALAAVAEAGVSGSDLARIGPNFDPFGWAHQARIGPNFDPLGWAPKTRLGPAFDPLGWAPKTRLGPAFDLFGWVGS